MCLLSLRNAPPVLHVFFTQAHVHVFSDDMAQQEKKKKESILDLSKYIDKPTRVKFQGGREVTGILKGFDPLLNLVLDGTTEFQRDPDDPYKITEDTRDLGLVVCRGTSLVLICPEDGMEQIANPFLQQEG
ncbi:U6 snRNA-associated Sm-like protein LSm7 [Acanthaster planci]|uniref:U6 snRNA-associated Sm-like protein LSm7 n=1 Tax=Acanthaster planci TaxID=133434 RepID=A0A8B7Z2I4_ACAPL|nr:U6 snRNA-associated Sm-like protein LSm7 [Acanthaster planci]